MKQKKKNFLSHPLKNHLHHFILASANEHKIQEFVSLFHHSFVTLEISKEKLMVEESGQSYRENAYLKAKAYYDRFHLPAIADDSGLEVHSLPNELGLYSARFGGEGLSDHQRCLLLLEKMQGHVDRTALFRCLLCVYCSPQEIYFFEGIMKGKLAGTLDVSEKQNAFGYDPLFIPECDQLHRPESSHDREYLDERTTLDQMVDWKNHHSHRAKAVLQMIQFFHRDKSS